MHTVTTSTLPIRKSPSDTSEMVSQLLYGERFSVLKTEGNWIEIKCQHDAYTGWVALEYEPQAFPDTPAVRITQPGQVQLEDGSILNLSPGSMVPGELKPSSPKSGRDLQVGVIESVLQYLNSPYLWGGRSICGIDCSGLVQVCCAIHGVSIPRDASQQAEIGAEVEWTNAEAGDLAFFKNSNGRITHVGLLLNKEEIVHASGRVRIDKLDSEGITRNTDGKRTHQLCCIKRIST